MSTENNNSGCLALAIIFGLILWLALSDLWTVWR